LARFFEIYENGEEHRYQEEDLPLVIGRSREAHVHLDRGRAVQAWIDLHEGKYPYLEPAAGAEDIFHNDQLVDERVWIKSGDRTRIGKWLITYRISGDRVEIIRREYTGPELPGTTVVPEQNGSVPETPLPVSDGADTVPKGRLKRNLFAGAAFLFLLLAALFVLTARSVVVTVDPQPDRMTISGSLPLLHFGNRYIGMSGTYRLHAVKTGYQDLEADVAVGVSEPTRYTYAMDRKPALLTVTGTPETAEVFLDGESLGRIPVQEKEVAGGRHQLTCRAERYREMVRSIDLEPGGRQVVECILESGRGRVFLVTDPAGATVQEGEEQLGVTPLTLELDPGKHVLVLRVDGFEPHTLEVTLTAGESLTPEVISLARARVRMEIVSIPEGALVSSKGNELGKTPLTLSWAPGSRHTLLFSREGYENVVREVAVREGKKQKVTVTLPREQGRVDISTAPTEAQLFIDGKRQKKNSGLFTLSTTTHKITVRARGYTTVQREVVPEKGKTKKLRFHLERKVFPVSSGSPAGETTTVEKKSGPPPGAVSVPSAVRAGSGMIRLEPGRFTMGASRRDPGRRANEGRHEVEITRPFLLGVHEVTNAEYHRFRPEHRAGVVGGISLDSDRQPVVKVSWQDAARYCNWLSRREGLKPFYREQGSSLVPVSPATNGYRLPFEAEWAFAARMVGRTRPGRYPWDGGFPPRSGSGNYADESARTIVPVVIKGYYDGYPVTAPVESFPRNMGGLFDMGGNVSEWCHDFYSPSPATAGTAKDPTGPATGRFHVYRGSSWRDGAITELRLSFRGYSDTPRDSLGFRVARFVQ